MTVPADPASATGAGPAADAGPSSTEGAGVISSWADVAAALGAEDVDPNQVGFAVAAAGLDTLGAALRPFDALLQAGLGWLVEHVDFLREPLDVLAGDPAAVLTQARDWQHVAGELRATAADYRAATVPGWAGSAAAGYHVAVGELTAAMSEAADQATALSRLILATGAGVGTVRALIRDAIVDFVATVVQYLLAAATVAFLTAGGSLATVVLGVVVRALEVAEDICRRLRLLLEMLAEAGDAAGRISGALLRATDRIKASEPALRAAGIRFQHSAEQVRAPEIIEAGKQLTAADRS